MKNNYLRLVMMLLLAVFTNAMQSRDFYAVNEDGDSVWYNDVVKTSVCHFYEVYQYYYNGDIVSDTAWYDNLSETKDGITSIVVLYSDGDTLWAGTMSDLKESTTSDDLFALDADEDTLWYNAAGKEFLYTFYAVHEENGKSDTTWYENATDADEDIISKFSAVNEDSVTIFYEITSHFDKSCVVANNDGDEPYTGTINIPDKVSYEDQTYTVVGIEEDAFYDCDQLTKVTLPATLKSVDSKAFEWCTQLQTITVDDNNEWFTAEDNILYNKDKTCLMLYPAGLTDATYTVPAGVTKIGDYAFNYNTHLEEVSMTAVETIGKHAFSWCSSLRNIILPNSLKVIGYATFWQDSLLTSIEIPATVDSIGKDAFTACTSLQSIMVDENNEKYCDEDGVLYTKDKTVLLAYPAAKEDTSYTVNTACKEMYSDAFIFANNLKEIILNEGLETMEEWAILGCSSLESLHLSSSLKEGLDGYFILACHALSTITMSEGSSNYTVENNVLFNKDKSQLIKYAYAKPDTVYIIPEDVKNIASLAFEDVQNLKKVVIPANVTEISYRAFWILKDHPIDTIECESVIPADVDGAAFDGDIYPSDYAVLVVPDGSKEAYLAIDPWNDFKTILTKSEVTGIKEINAPASVTTDDRIYDLQGRRLDMKPENGLYIKGGKKYLTN